MGSEWLDPGDITLIQPKTPEQVEALMSDLRELVALLPEWEEEYFEGIKEYPYYLTLIYHHDKPVGFIQIEDSDGYEHLGKSSLEFSGAVLPEYRNQGITLLVGPTIIKNALRTRGKKKMLASVQPDNKEARVALTALGFRLIGKDRNKNPLYLYDRSN